MKCPPTLENVSRPPEACAELYSTFVKSVASYAYRVRAPPSSVQTIPFDVPFAETLGTVPTPPKMCAVWELGEVLNFACETVNAFNEDPEGPM